MSINHATHVLILAPFSPYNDSLILMTDEATIITFGRDNGGQGYSTTMYVGRRAECERVVEVHTHPHQIIMKVSA